MKVYLVMKSVWNEMIIHSLAPLLQMSVEKRFSSASLGINITHI